MSEKTLNSDEQFCSSCGEVIMKEAEICPKCGVRVKDAPSFFYKYKKISLIALVLVILVIVIIEFSGDGNDTCEDIVPEVVDLSKDGAPWIHQIYNIQEWSRTDSQTFLCIGAATMSSGDVFKIQFFSEVDSEGTVWIGYEERSVGN